MVRGITTRTRSGESEDATWRELSTVLIVDDVIPAIRESLRARFRRAKNTEQSRGAIRSQVVLELENKKYLCFGGAESQDVEDREPGVNWWREEMPSEEEYAFCEENLAACDYKVDYVLTHDAPSRFLDFTALASGETNQLHSFLDKILLKLTYDKWFFGCYHKDTQLSTKSRCVFCDVISMGERHAKRSVR